MAIRFGLIGEVIAMAFDTVRTNKLRSGLTVLGVVIGITSIVGMTALIRGATQERVFYRDQKTKALLVFGTTEKFAEGTRIPFRAGRYFNGTELQYRANVCVIGYTAFKKLFEDTGFDPIGKTVRIGAQRFTVVGAFDKRANAGGFLNNADDFVAMPYT